MFKFIDIFVHRITVNSGNFGNLTVGYFRFPKTFDFCDIFQIELASCHFCTSSVVNVLVQLGGRRFGDKAAQD